MTHVRVEVTERVARVTLDHPELRNALTAEVASDLVDAMERVADSDARCVLVRAEGPAFCAGGDVNALVETDDDVPVRETVERTAAAVTAVATCETPTVAAVDGPAYGAGASLVVACDVVLASEAAGISFGARRLGLALDAGASYFLPRIVGESTAKELVYTGEMVEADRAEQLGVFNRVYPAGSFDEEVTAFVDRLAEGPTAALSASKRLIEAGGRRSLPDAVAAEVDAQVALADTADHAEAVRAFVEQRDPEFVGE